MLASLLGGRDLKALARSLQHHLPSPEAHLTEEECCSLLTQAYGQGDWSTYLQRVHAPASPALAPTLLPWLSRAPMASWSSAPGHLWGWTRDLAHSVPHELASRQDDPARTTVVVGDPGSGVSTALHAWVVDAARQAQGLVVMARYDATHPVPLWHCVLAQEGHPKAAQAVQELGDAAKPPTGVDEARLTRQLDSAVRHGTPCGVWLPSGPHEAAWAGCASRALRQVLAQPDLPDRPTWIVIDGLDRWGEEALTVGAATPGVHWVLGLQSFAPWMREVGVRRAHEWMRACDQLLLLRHAQAAEAMEVLLAAPSGSEPSLYTPALGQMLREQAPGQALLVQGGQRQSLTLPGTLNPIRSRHMPAHTLVTWSDAHEVYWTTQEAREGLVLTDVETGQAVATALHAVGQVLEAGHNVLIISTEPGSMVPEVWEQWLQSTAHPRWKEALTLDWSGATPAMERGLVHAQKTLRMALNEHIPLLLHLPPRHHIHGSRVRARLQQLLYAVLHERPAAAAPPALATLLVILDGDEAWGRAWHPSNQARRQDVGLLWACHAVPDTAVPQWQAVEGLWQRHSTAQTWPVALPAPQPRRPWQLLYEARLAPSVTAPSDLRLTIMGMPWTPEQLRRMARRLYLAWPALAAQVRQKTMDRWPLHVAQEAAARILGHAHWHEAVKARGHER